MGMPKTGTTALQRALSMGGSALSAGQLIYPEAFRDQEGTAHHILAQELVKRNDLAGPEVTKFLAMVEQAADARVLISSEAFLNLLTPIGILTLLTFLDLCKKRTSVKIVIACRRLDAFVESMYLHSIKTGELKSDPAEYIEARRRWALSLFRELSVLRNIGWLQAVTLIKYDQSESYVRAMYEACGLTPAEQLLAGRPGSANQRLGAKAQAFLQHLPQFENLLGRPIDRPHLIRSFEGGIFEFKDEIKSYSVFPIGERWFLHEAALRAALQFGIQEYVEFFRNDLVTNKPQVTLTPGLLSALDIESIKEFLDRTAQ